jgi:uncharacterized protein YraI
MVNDQIQGIWTRRDVLKRFAKGTAALALAGAVLAGGFSASVSAGTGTYRTTSSLNLRSGPGTNYSVLLVIPQGGLVTQVGPDQNNFKKVSYNGTVGWAYGSYLVVENGGGGDIPAYRGDAYTTDAVNMRSGPGTNYSVLLVIPAGATIEVYDEYANYFWLVRYKGQFGYVHSNYISDNGGGQEAGTLKTTAAVNLRSEPSLSAKVLLVIPAGTYVQGSDQFANGYRQVTVTSLGVTGWVYNAYLA